MRKRLAWWIRWLVFRARAIDTTKRLWCDMRGHDTELATFKYHRVNGDEWATVMVWRCRRCHHIDPVPAACHPKWREDSRLREAL
jgi:hypothetical protein